MEIEEKTNGQLLPGSFALCVNEDPFSTPTSTCPILQHNDMSNSGPLSAIGCAQKRPQSSIIDDRRLTEFERLPIADGAKFSWNYKTVLELA
ncbi:unnamed protein product [Toxocara canis]|uniref:Uncharacterized protein n=1 Tax=Toxocara canis TaxID=6265 RepID=A0A183V9P2_TOXCA|nr:unnamed protein product [Toxocara canis]